MGVRGPHSCTCVHVFTFFTAITQLHWSYFKLLRTYLDVLVLCMCWDGSSTPVYRQVHNSNSTNSILHHICVLNLLVYSSLRLADTAVLGRSSTQVRLACVACELGCANSGKGWVALHNNHVLFIFDLLPCVQSCATSEYSKRAEWCTSSEIDICPAMRNNYGRKEKTVSVNYERKGGLNDLRHVFKAYSMRNNFVENAFKRIFACKSWLRYSRERAL